MDAQVKDSIVITEDVGNIPASEVKFYTDEKPTIATANTHRVAYLRYKVDKESNTKRASMAVVVPRFDSDNLTAKSEHDFLCSLVADWQDSCLKLVADKSAPWELVTDISKMIQEYNDTTRTSSGRKVTKESLGEWYMTHLGAYVAKRALLKNAQMKDETVAKVVEGYKEMFQKFTKYDLAHIFTEPQFVLVKQIVAECKAQIPADDELLEYVESKIAKIEAAKIANDNLAEMI